MNTFEEKEKDFLYKIQILRNALLQEKQKVSQLEKEICYLKSSDGEAKSLIKGEYDLISVSTNFNSDNNKSCIVKSTTIDAREDSINSIISNLQATNDNLKRNLDESSESILSMKNSFQQIINLHIEKIKSLDEKLENLNNNNNRISSNLNTYSDQQKTNEIQIQNLENEIKNLKDNIIHIKEQSDASEEQIKQYKMSIVKLENDLLSKNEENERIIQKMKDYKKMFLEENIKDVQFSALKKEVFKSQKLNLLFTSHEGKLTLVIAYEGRNKKYIPIENIDVAKVHSEGDNSVELKYFQDKKLKNKTYHLDQKASHFINTYKDYSAKAIRLRLNKEIFDSNQ